MAVLAWIFTHTGRLPSEILALPAGERSICMTGARLAIIKEARLPPAIQLVTPRARPGK